jgi:riboflavin kinase / FMN adenylyltransferase
LKVYHLTDGIKIEKPIVLTIGTFDGVHAGHLAVISVLEQKANEIGGETALLTFHPHPRVVLHPHNHKLKLLNSQEEKIKLLGNAGLNHLIMARFDKNLARLTPLEYVRGLLVEGIRPSEVVIGDDHRFGRNREGSFDDLKEMGVMFGFGVTALDAEKVSNVRVSSTKIRKAIYEGEVGYAGTLLSHLFPMSGRVVRGDQIGRTLGFPTANLQLKDELKIVPAKGAYVVWAKIEDGDWMPGMLNIGNRPTMNASEDTIELHIIGFDGDCYGKRIDVQFVDRLREEQKFSGHDELKAALSHDKLKAMSILADTKPPQQ